jgi:hypothetical protein
VIHQTIRLHVRVISDYNQLSTACSNEQNQAFANYRGVVNTTPVVGEGSFASVSCNFGSPTSTNFLVDINGQTLKELKFCVAQPSFRHQMGTILFLVHKPYWNSCYKYKSNLYQLNLNLLR